MALDLTNTKNLVNALAQNNASADEKDSLRFKTLSDIHFLINKVDGIRASAESSKDDATAIAFFAEAQLAESRITNLIGLLNLL